MKRILLVLLMAVTLLGVSACSEADVVANNLSKDAEEFKVLRKVVFYNGITDEYMFAIEGFCSIYADNEDEQLEVTCMVGEGLYEKHYLGLSDNVSYMVLQLDPSIVDPYHYKVYLRPQTLIPDIELDTEENPA